ncbi:hypothetical protein PDJAM_G00030490, partial [Pangasius djambal]|nr:hypothetical protein [Pangasius djambal]
GFIDIYNCQQGYVGKVIFVCDGHKWENTRNAKCSCKRCQLPEDIPNGRFTLINGTEFIYGATIKYTCRTGYRMVSLVDTRTCLAEGWNNLLPECEGNTKFVVQYILNMIRILHWPCK